MPSRRTGSELEAGDLAIVRRVMEGDEAALAALYDRYAGVVYSVAWRVLRDAEAAEEILQDIFYQFWRTAANFDPARGSLAGWLLVTARNRAFNNMLVDLFWDLTGEGNTFENNHCVSSLPGGLCAQSEGVSSEVP